MTRLEFLEILLVPQVLASQDLQHDDDLPVKTGIPVVDNWNRFTKVANEWVMLRKFDPPDTYDFKARKLWDQVRKAFHEVDVVVRSE